MNVVVNKTEGRKEDGSEKGMKELSCEGNGQRNGEGKK